MDILAFVRIGVVLEAPGRGIGENPIAPLEGQREARFVGSALDSVWSIAGRGRRGHAGAWSERIDIVDTILVGVELDDADLLVLSQ